MNESVSVLSSENLSHFAVWLDELWGSLRSASSQGRSVYSTAQGDKHPTKEQDGQVHPMLRIPDSSSKMMLCFQLCQTC